jgi:hypothetical protein
MMTIYRKFDVNYSNIFDNNRSEFFLNILENFLLNIKLCMKNDWFTLFYIAVFHNNDDCLKCDLFHIFSRFVRLLLSKMTTIVSVSWKNRLRLFVAKKYEMSRVFSLIVTNLINTHFLQSSWFYMIQFIYDSVFWIIVLSLYF